MKIISKNKDFYDWVLGTTGVDTTLVWNRTPSTFYIKPATPHRNNSSNLFIPIENSDALSRAEKLGYNIEKATNFLNVECVDIQLPTQIENAITVQNPYTAYCTPWYSVEQFQIPLSWYKSKVMVEHVSVLGCLIPFLHDTESCVYHHSLIEFADLEAARHLSAVERSPLLEDKGSVDFNKSNPLLNELHKLFMAPIFHIERVQMGKRSEKYCYVVTTNAPLVDFGLAKHFSDHLDLFQRITQFFSTLTQPDTVEIVDDKILRDKAGFNDKSFKKEKSTK